MWAKTFSRPRWDIPNTTRLAPDLADSSSARSNMGTMMSVPSMEKRF